MRRLWFSRNRTIASAVVIFATLTGTGFAASVTTSSTASAFLGDAQTVYFGLTNSAGFDSGLVDLPSLSEDEFEPLHPDEGENPFLEPSGPFSDEGDCDLTGDGLCDCADIDELTDILAAGGGDSTYDLDGSGSVDFGDRDHLIKELMDSTFGDANQDGVFGPNDFVVVFSHGYYDNPDPGRPLSFCEGDWNGDGVFDSSDLVLAFEESVYTPEPSAGLLFIIGLLGLVRRRC